MIKGFKVCPAWLKEKYKDAVKHCCQRCHKHEKDVGTLQIHRLKRGNKLGIYTIVPLNHKENNILVCCSACHKLFHQGDNRRISI